nr:RNA-directed DNA polymerase, eukaryota [Tanacetum cinerariifolium]
MGVNVEDGKIQNVASKLGCLVLKTLFTYIGTKVCENMSRNEAWKEVVDKEVRSLKGTGMVDLICLKLGNGDSFLFWEDKWRVRSGAEESQFNSLLEIVQVINLVPCEDRMEIDTLMYPVCKGGVETTSHLFFQCVLSKQIMRKVSSWWNDDYMDVSSYKEWRLWLVSIRIPNKLKSMMEGVFYGLWWSIWNFRNKLLSDNKTPKKALIFDNLVSLSFNWCKYICKASFK